MPPPLDTGFATSDAQDDFQRARRRQMLSTLARRVGREPGDVDVILPYDEVVEALGYVGEHYEGLETVPLDAILGTVDRKTGGFDRNFRPTSARVRARWERIANAVRRGERMPPISLFRIGEVYFVRDGHHRVSVARALGRTQIDAYVVEVETRVGAERSLRVADLPLKSHERVFYERVPLPARARPRMQLSDAWRFGVLAEAVEAWSFRLMQDRAAFLDRGEAARLWFDEEYVPVVDMLSEADMIGERTETDAYLDVAMRRYQLMRTHEWTEEVLARVRDEPRSRKGERGEPV
ncbi:MAG: chromosome partitioning protein ParB [Solirubrobacteraceae bacterium]